MAVLTRTIRVGVNEVRYVEPQYTPFDVPGSLDGMVLCHEGEDAFDLDISIRKALAVLTLASEYPDLVAQHREAIQRLTASVAA